MAKIAERLLYKALFVLLFLSFVLLAIKVVGVAEEVWLVFYKVYIFLALARICDIFLMLLLVDMRGIPRGEYRDEKIAVIVPVYNESATLVENTVYSILRAKGRKDIFIVNDGSSNALLNETLRKLAQNKGVVVAEF